MRKILIILSFISYVFAINDLYTDDYYFRKYQVADKIETKERTNSSSNKNTNGSINASEPPLAIRSKDIVKSKPQNTAKPKTAKKAKPIHQEPAKCDVIKRMKDKTYYSPSKNIFYIGDTKYEILPKDFKDCGVTFVGVSSSLRDINFELDDQSVISGKLQANSDDLDENFFYSPKEKQTQVTISKKEDTQTLAECNFVLPSGIRTALDENNKVIHIPQAYKNQVVKLYYEKYEDFTYVSNSGFAKIKISKANFNNNCKILK